VHDCRRRRSPEPEGREPEDGPVGDAAAGQHPRRAGGVPATFQP
jgi:hypothetical protein